MKQINEIYALELDNDELSVLIKFHEELLNHAIDKRRNDQAKQQRQHVKVLRSFMRKNEP